MIINPMGCLKIRYYVNKELFAFLLIVIIGFILFIKNLSVENVCILQDEYCYKARSDIYLNQAKISENQLAPVIPNIVYTFVYSICSFWGKNSYIISKLLNVIFYCSTAFPIYLLSRHVGLSSNQSLSVAIVGILLPYSNYTNFFIPEAMYYFMYWTSVLIYYNSILRGTVTTSFFAGFFTGLLYYIKPHAATIVLLNIIFILFQPIRRKSKVLLSNIIGNASTILVCTYLGGKSTVITNGIYYDVLRNVFNHFIGMGWKAILKDIGYVASGHFIYFSIFYLFPLIVALVIYFRKKTPFEESESYASFNPMNLITDYALYSLTTLSLLSIGFSVFVQEIGRVHMRYYSFLFPFLFIILFGYSKLQLSKKNILMFGASIILCYSITLLYYSKYSELINITFISDGQEEGIASFGNFLGALSISFMLLISLIAMYFKEHCWMYICSVIILSIMVSISAWNKETGSIFNDRFAKGLEATFLEELLGTKQIAHTVIVGDYVGSVDKLLFFLNGTPHVEYRKRGSVLAGIFSKYQDATAFVALYEDYIIPEEDKCFSYKNQIRVCYKNDSK